MVNFPRRGVANKILVAVISAVLIIMGAEIVVRIYFGTRDRIELLNTLARELGSSIYAGMRYPMEVGDAKAIRRELANIRETARDVEVFISNFANEIVYSTHEDKVNARLGDVIHNKMALDALGDILQRGIESAQVSEDEVNGERFLVYFRPVLNEEGCHHCHGASREILGTMSIRLNAEKAYGTVTAQRNRTLVLMFFGIPALIGMIYLIVNRFVRRPVSELVKQAERFAGGDTSARIDVTAEDEIGVLARTFNLMVENVSSSSKALEKEIARKTALLDERTRLISLLEKANRQLRELDSLKSTFLANMSHELRTPMNAIIGYTDLIMDGVDGPINQDQEKSLKRIAANAKSLLQLINDILDISKIESGRVKLEPKELDLRWLLDSVIATFEPIIKEKGLTLSDAVEKDFPPIYGDEDAIRRVLINLISNAVKFTERGEVRVNVSRSARGVAPGNPPIFAEICVEDTGIGIRQEDLGTIFDKFVQVDLTTVRQREGTGLGLSIARALVALHKGMIWAESTYGKGSRFCFTVPLTKDIVDRPEKPVIEKRMAEALGEYFGKPAEMFLKEPRYAGKILRCRDYVRCGHPMCPAYASEESRCWLILGTHCAGMKIASYPEKVDFCKGCELIESLVLNAAEQEEKSEGVDAPTETDSRKTVLAIDDNLDDIDIIRKYLGDAYDVVGLIGGDNAVETAKEMNPLAITLDIMMPGKDGWQVLAQLKQNPETSDIPVIIVSIVDEKSRGFSLGAAEYIVKPVKKEALLERLKSLEKLGRISRILIVDSDRKAMRFMGGVLQQAGYHIQMAYNSKDAIKSIESGRPDLAIISLAMPEAEGFDVFEFLRTHDAVKDIPLIVIAKDKLTEKELDELNGRIRAILNKAMLSRDDFLERLEATIARVSKPNPKDKEDDIAEK